jgi:hypothetical protein
VDGGSIPPISTIGRYRTFFSFRALGLGEVMALVPEPSEGSANADEVQLADGLLGLLQLRLSSGLKFRRVGNEPTYEIDDEEVRSERAEAIMREVFDEFYQSTMRLDGADMTLAKHHRNRGQQQRRARERVTATLRHPIRATGRALADCEKVNWELPEALRSHLRSLPEGEWLSLIEVLPTENGAVGGLVLRILLLGSLHARSIRIVDEVLALVVSGHADGAVARCRTLIEVVTVLLSISQTWDELHSLAERYQVWALWENPQDRDDATTSAIETAWGPGFFAPNGWARPLVPSLPPRARISFRDLTEATGLGSYFEQYRDFSHQVHAGPTSTVMGTDLHSAHLYQTRLKVDIEFSASVLRFSNSVLGLATECFARDAFKQLGHFDSLGWLSPALRSVEKAIKSCREFESPPIDESDEEL